MDPFSVGIFIILIAALLIGGALVAARLTSNRRGQLLSSEEPPIPVNLTSVNDAVLVARIGGQVSYVNEVAREWFALEGGAPDLWLLSRRVSPPDAFLELFATEGQADFEIDGRSIRASSHRVAVGEAVQFIVVLREQAPLPVLDREERGSPRALQALADISRTINASLIYEDTLTAVLEGIRRLVPYDAAQISLFNTEREFLQPVVRAGTPEYVAATRG
ncbi:MAG: hypothetical protein IT326_08100, partial [Anaerolineae bacterium]|nr:hypothetical protein [Anaerolineae bacterium]